MAYRDFTRMPVWQKGHALLKNIYQLTSQFPKEEKYGLTADMRRSVNSLIHNLAEGFGRFENMDKSRFYKISRGSTYELISQLHASKTIGYTNLEESGRLIKASQEIIGELDKLIRTVENR